MFVLISIAGALIAVAVYWDIFLFFFVTKTVFSTKTTSIRPSRLISQRMFIFCSR